MVSPNWNTPLSNISYLLIIILHGTYSDSFALYIYNAKSLFVDKGKMFMC